MNTDETRASPGPREGAGGTGGKLPDLSAPRPSGTVDAAALEPAATTTEADPALAAQLRAAIDLTRAPAIPGYQIVRPLSEGGQGIVFEAVQLSTRRKVAIKLLRDGEYASTTARKRFEREIELVAQLKHPNIIGIFDSGTTPDGRQYYVMDYVRGAPLHVHVRERKLPLEESLRLFVTIAGAVQYAHQRGIVHRDLKPSNVLVDVSGEPKVLDFGLAKWLAAPVDTVVSVSQQIIGTLPYMSPEQTKGNPEEVDARTDVYALGVMLYHVLTGSFPYPVEGSVADVLHHISSTPPAQPRKQWSSGGGVSGRGVRRSGSGSCPIDEEVETIVLKALAKERERRYPSAGALATDLGRYLAGEAIEARRDSLAYRARRTLRRNRGTVITGVLVAVTLGVGLFFGIAANLRAAGERARAERVERASQLTSDAERLIADPAGQARAAALLDEAIAISPTLDRAWIARGLLHARRGLDARLEDKAAHVQAALADLMRAHLAAGGQRPAGVEVAAGPGPAGTGAGSPAALWMLADLLALTSRETETEASAVLAALAAMPQGAGSAAAMLAPQPVYDVVRDSLRAPQRIEESPETSRKRPDDGVVLRQLVRGPIDTLNPLEANDYATYVAELLFEPLFVINAELRCIANPNVIVENGCRRGSDGRSWTITLRDGLRWHDGEPFTAYDVAFTRGLLRRERPDIVAATAEDERTVRFELREAMTEDRAHYAMKFYVVPQHVVENPARGLGELRTAPIGSGPFRFKSRSGPERVDLVRWDDYSGPRPYLAGMVFEHVRDPLERARCLADGRAHVAELSSAEYRWLINGASFRGAIYKLCDQEKAEYDCLCWNFRGNPYFADPRVRQAMTQALDLDLMRDMLTGGLYRPCLGPFPPDKWMADRKIVPFRHDPGEAAALLDAAGWRFDPAAADGVRMRGGERFEFTLLTTDDALGRGVGMLVQRQLAEVGVRVVVDPQPWEGGFKSRRDAGEFGAVLSSVRSIGHPAGALEHFVRNGSRNYGKYDSRAVADLFAAATRETDDREEPARYQELHRHLYHDQPFTFLWQKRPLWAFSTRVRGVRGSALGPVGFYPGQRGWWVLAEPD